MAAVATIEAQIGKRIRELRRRQGKSIERLADQAGLHPNSLGLIERGDRAPGLGALVGIAEALGVDLPTLVDVGEPRGARELRRLISKRAATMTREQLRAALAILDAVRFQ